MMLTHVTNKGGGLSPEVGIAQIPQALAENRFVINQCNVELLQQLRLYHRGNDSMGLAGPSLGCQPSDISYALTT